MGQILKTSQVGVTSQFKKNFSLVANLRRLTIVFRFYSTLTVEGFNKVTTSIISELQRNHVASSAVTIATALIAQKLTQWPLFFFVSSNFTWKWELLHRVLKNSWSRIYEIAKNRKFWLAINPVQRIFFNFTSSFLLVYTTQF